MSWFAKLLPARIRTNAARKKGVPEGLWTKCQGCDVVLYAAELARQWGVCNHCDYHHRLPARKRLEHLWDGPAQDLAYDIGPRDFLKFRDSKKYKDRLSQAQKDTGEQEALMVQQGSIYGIDAVACAFEFQFMGGSMSSAVGERFVRGVQTALSAKLPFICFSASGGARMQEGVISLFQMAKTSMILADLREAGLPFLSVLTDPTMGGVSASLAMLGDVIWAEPKALIGFAGPRVIEKVVREMRETLPEGFQRSEFLWAHGAIDAVVSRHTLPYQIAVLLAQLTHQPSPPTER